MKRLGLCIIGQFLIFYLTANLFRFTLFPFNSWFQSPNWAVNLAYGSLFLLPLVLAGRSIRLIIAIVSCVLVWSVSIYLKIADPGFIAHGPLLYMAVAAVCIICNGFERWRPPVVSIGLISVLISLYTLITVQVYGIKTDSMHIAVILGQNLLFFIQSVAACLGTHNGRKITRKSYPDPQVFEYKQAA